LGIQYEIYNCLIYFEKFVKHYFIYKKRPLAIPSIVLFTPGPSSATYFEHAKNNALAIDTDSISMENKESLVHKIKSTPYRYVAPVKGLIWGGVS
jgi:uncharacterized circularly permuted ATP-grasp superfamily protein